MENTLGTGTRRAPASIERAVSKSLKAPVTPSAKAKPSSTSGPQIARLDDSRASRSGSFKHHATLAPRATTYASLADVMLSIGTLPAGESVTITFRVTVDNPFNGGSPQVSNQGTVSGSNFADVLTDDPSVGGAADPTVTPIDLPQVSVAVSPSSVAEDGATNLTYTFTRTGSTTNPTCSSASARSIIWK